MYSLLFGPSRMSGLIPGAEDLVGGERLAEPLFDHVERAHVGLSLSAVQASVDDLRYPRSLAPRPVDSTATSVAVPPSTRLSTPARRRKDRVRCGQTPSPPAPDDRFVGRGATSSMTWTAGVPSIGGHIEQGAPQRGVRPDPGEPLLVLTAV